LADFANGVSLGGNPRYRRRLNHRSRAKNRNLASLQVDIPNRANPLRNYAEFASPARVATTSILDTSITRSRSVLGSRSLRLGWRSECTFPCCSAFAWATMIPTYFDADAPTSGGVAEAYLFCGRRAGKPFILALVAVYLAIFQDWSEYLAPGERGTINGDRRR
jgi:hypothetical protein